MESKETRYKRWSMHRDPAFSTQLVEGGNTALTPILSGPLINKNVHRGHEAPTRRVSFHMSGPSPASSLQLLFAVDWNRSGRTLTRCR